MENVVAVEVCVVWVVGVEVHVDVVVLIIVVNVNLIANQDPIKRKY
jgi:hypothetical protein